MSDTLIQIVDDNDKPVGALAMQEAWQKGLTHRIVRIMVEDTAGRVLLQLRNTTQKLYPNCWDNSAAGHVDAGETYEVAAARELAEEIGLKGVSLEEIGYYRSNKKFENYQLNRFNKVYKTVVSPDIKIILQPEEVADAKWFTVSEIKETITKHPEQVSDGIIEVFERYY